MTRKAIFFGLLLLLLFMDFQHIHAADSGACTKPKVAVKLKDFDKIAYELLIRQYPFATKENWIQRVHSNVLEQLRAKSPGVIFLPSDSENDAEYVLDYSIALQACGRDIKIGELLAGTEACYLSHGQMKKKPACGTEVGTVLAARVQNRDIFASIALFVKGLGRLDTAIVEHERVRLIPPRGPRLDVKPQSRSISPLEDERGTTIEALLTNCKGEPVYDKDQERRYAVLAGPRESERGQTKPSPERGDQPSGNEWCISPTEKGLVGLKYELKRGIRPATETLKFDACGLGARVTQRAEIHIDGLEISVKPQKTQVKPGEDTRIDIEFAKVSVKGERKPIPGKVVNLKIEGLKDGVLNPKDKVTTNAEGKATLVYQAGQNDRSIRVIAFYQPQNFPDKAEGSAIITVQEGKGDLAVQINGTLNWTGEDKDTRGTITSNFTISGTMTLHKQKHGGDYENYEIENMQMTYSHHAQFHRKKTSRECPERLFLEVQGEGSAPVQKGRIVIRYPREAAGVSRKQGELDLRLSSGLIPAKWENCPESCKCQTSDKNIGVSIEVVDQKSPITRNQQEFSGSRSFGIADLRGALNLISLGSLAWSFNDNESKQISTFPLMPKELEKVIAESRGTIEQMRDLGIGINKDGNNGRLTWRIRKIKNRD